MVTTNRKIVKNNKKIYTFEGPKLVVTDVTKRKEYIELFNNFKDVEEKLSKFKERLTLSINMNNSLKEDYNKIKQEFDRIVELGALEYYKLRLL